MSRVKSDAMRVGVPFLVATLLVMLSVPLATAIDEPAYAAWGLFAGLAMYGVALSHVLRRVLFPYLNLKAFALRAFDNPIGAGLVFVGVCLVLMAFVLLMGNVAHAGELPTNAVKYLPTLKAEQRAYWPNMPLPSALGAQVEQETCISLRSPRCWSPRAELKTDREQGVGLGQITRTARFDSLAEVRASNRKALAGWSWDKASLYDARYQLRAMVLMDRRCFDVMVGTASTMDRLAMAFSCYNGGAGGVNSDRRLCRATAGCNAAKWFGHVEHTSLKRKTAVAGYAKSFFKINREYVRNVLIVRRPRYVPALEAS